MRALPSVVGSWVQVTGRLALKVETQIPAPSNQAMLSMVSPQTNAKLVGGYSTAVDYVLAMPFFSILTSPEIPWPTPVAIATSEGSTHPYQ
jgi:hypothetical protein